MVGGRLVNTASPLPWCKWGPLGSWDSTLIWYLPGGTKWWVAGIVGTLLPLVPSQVNWGLQGTELSTLPCSNRTMWVSLLLPYPLLSVGSVRKLSLHPYKEGMRWCRLVPHFHWGGEWSWTSIPPICKNAVWLIAPLLPGWCRWSPAGSWINALTLPAHLYLNCWTAY